MIELELNGVSAGLNDIFLEYNKTYKSTKKPVRKGKWYFEFTHKSGDGYHIVGFSGEGNLLGIYARKDYPSSHLICPSDRCVVGDHSDMNFTTINEDSTVGIGLDLENNLISFISSKETKGYFFERVYSNSTFNAIVYEAPSGYTDTVSVNFGIKPFANKIPAGYKPWDTSFYQ